MNRRSKTARLLTGGLVGALPVTTPGDEHWDDVSLLIRGDTLTDLSGNHTINNSGVTAGDTTYTKHSASGSMSFGGSSDFISIADDASLEFGSGDFTVEAWVYHDGNMTTGDYVFFAGKTNADANKSPFIFGTINASSGSAPMRFLVGTSSTYYTAQDTADFPISQWVHVAGTRNGNTITLWINGQAKATATLPTGAVVVDNIHPLYIGKYVASMPTGAVHWKGNIEDFRITKGVARYTANFTPPTASLPTNAPIVGRRGVGSVLAVDTFATLDDTNTPHVVDPANNLSVNFNAGTTHVASTQSVSSGKYYAEYRYDNFDPALNGPNGSGFIAASVMTQATRASNDDALSYYGYDGNTIMPARTPIKVTYGDTVKNIGDIIGLALDADTGFVWYSKNGIWQDGSGNGATSAQIAAEIAAGTTTNAANPSNTLAGAGPFWLGFGSNSSIERGSEGTANFGQDATFDGAENPTTTFTDANGLGEFYYEPPAGFTGLYTTIPGTLRTRGYVGAAPAGSRGMLTLYDRLLNRTASGGLTTDITVGGQDYRVHTFNSSDTLTVHSELTDVEYLVIGGGGGGGSGGGGAGGGGAGGYRCSVQGETTGGGGSAEAMLNLSRGNYTITVGAGGVQQGTNRAGTSGGDSSIGALVTATGGGGGGGRTSGEAVGKSGGSGGGGSDYNPQNGAFTAAGGPASPSGQGYGGGTGYYSGSGLGGGGGGGASAPGGNGSTTNTGGNGGAGMASSITGTSVTRAGGGGAGSLNVGSGGAGGGGDGGRGGVSNAVSGTPNTGGGGGGGSNSDGGDGGSGVVIVRYKI